MQGAVDARAAEGVAAAQRHGLGISVQADGAEHGFARLLQLAEQCIRIVVVVAVVVVVLVVIVVVVVVFVGGGSRLCSGGAPTLFARLGGAAAVPRRNCFGAEDAGYWERRAILLAFEPAHCHEFKFCARLLPAAE